MEVPQVAHVAKASDSSVMQTSLQAAIQALPYEVQDQIREYAGVEDPRAVLARHRARNAKTDPSIPPADGSCPFLKLPYEARRKILLAFLPAKDQVIQPSLTGNPESRTCNLMVLCSQVCHELTTVLYEERTFRINVHEGITTGGVEFLNSGIQPLQYKMSLLDSRFKRFEGEKNQFGFERLKRLEVVIHPCKTSRSKTSRHDPMMTYFTINTMLELLRKNGSIELNYLKIIIAEASNSPGAVWVPRLEHYWWNSDTNKASETSIYGISNAELVLRGFLRIDKVHNVEIELPEGLKTDGRIREVADQLLHLLKDKDRKLDHVDCDLEHKLVVARDALDAYIFKTKYGEYSVPDLDSWIDISDLQFSEDDYEDYHDWTLSMSELDELNEEQQISVAERFSRSYSQAIAPKACAPKACAPAPCAPKPCAPVAGPSVEPHRRVREDIEADDPFVDKVDQKGKRIMPMDAERLRNLALMKKHVGDPPIYNGPNNVQQAARPTWSARPALGAAPQSPQPVGPQPGTQLVAGPNNAQQAARTQAGLTTAIYPFYPRRSARAALGAAVVQSPQPAGPQPATQPVAGPSSTVNYNEGRTQAPLIVAVGSRQAARAAFRAALQSPQPAGPSSTVNYNEGRAQAPLIMVVGPRRSVRAVLGAAVQSPQPAGPSSNVNYNEGRIPYTNLFRFPVRTTSFSYMRDITPCCQHHYEYEMHGDKWWIAPLEEMDERHEAKYAEMLEGWAYKYINYAHAVAGAAQHHGTVE